MIQEKEIPYVTVDEIEDLVFSVFRLHVHRIELDDRDAGRIAREPVYRSPITLADRALGGENSDQLINDLQHFVAQSDKFVMGHAQTTTVFNARFENEIGGEGTAGTAANSLIHGLQNHDMGEIAAAANQLITNASDVAGNNRQANGDTYDAVIQAATGSTAPFIALQGGSRHHDDQQSNNVQSTGTDVGHHSDTDVGHHSDLASTFAQFWHHG